MMISALEEGEKLYSLDGIIRSEAETCLDTPMDDLYLLVDGHRYIVPRHIYKNHDFTNCFFFKLLDDSFRQLTLMFKSAFLFVLSEVDGHSIFRNQSNNDKEED
ncbi:hypothetical protein PHYBOEH_006799 [Phytophthora boehmeriae]|uniref:Uncharacterized protein n=1 Tax=Phytophthora boehmeriae TaxID=109152 RepID=A0A8T1WFW8_9STRA|nr:hypothetical protein PHYBOEH_006799 [Phytophthora boehmeriae]